MTQATKAVLHPELVPMLSAMPDYRFAPEHLETMRNAMRTGMEVELSDDVARTDHTVSDDPNVVVRVHRPRHATGDLPCVYSIHGGGYIVGSYAMDDARFNRWCLKFNCVGVSVEYRLSPETAYPGPLDDCYAGLQWTWSHAAELGIDRRRLGIAGSSAGGGLAAGLALLARDRAEIPLAFQLLEFPMLDDRQVTPSSRLDELIVWNPDANTYGWQSYLGDLYGTDAIPPYAAATRATDVSGLPPTLVITGGADGFRDEDIEYASRLIKAGVQTELHVVPGAPHGVGMFAGTSIARRWTGYIEDWLRRQLEGTEG
ncbi:MAG: alpha/beta hydrolase [Acidimicrobiia bacterium]